MCRFIWGVIVCFFLSQIGAQTTGSLGLSDIGKLLSQVKAQTTETLGLSDPSKITDQATKTAFEALAKKISLIREYRCTMRIINQTETGPHYPYVSQIAFCRPTAYYEMQTWDNPKNPKFSHKTWIIVQGNKLWSCSQEPWKSPPGLN